MNRITAQLISCTSCQSCQQLGFGGALGFFDFRFFLAFLRLGRLDLLAELQVGTEASSAQCHFKAGFRIFAKDLLALNAIGVRRDLPGEIAFRVVRAADKSAEAPGLQ